MSDQALRHILTRVATASSSRQTSLDESEREVQSTLSLSRERQTATGDELARKLSTIEMFECSTSQ